MNLLDPYFGRDAVLKALEGDRRPLAARLRAAARAAARDENILTPDELNLAADIVAPSRRGPLTSPVKVSLRPDKAIAVAGAVLRSSHGYQRDEIKAAIDKVAEDNRRSKAWVKNHVRTAKRYLDGRWWQFKVEKFRRK